MRLLRHRHVLALSLAALLAACATTPPEATVQVFTAQPRLAPGTTYRFDRLPSQAAQPQQAALEAAAESALARAGLRRDDAGGRLSVQLSNTQDRPTGYPGWGGGPQVGLGIGGGGGGGSVGIGFGIPIGGGGMTQSAQRVDVVLRELASGQVVFQSQASGSSGASPVNLVEAALRDFPHSQPGTRQVPLAVAPAAVR